MNTDFLRGKRILFIGPVFYNYHNEIINELEKMGASVDFYAEKPMYKLFIFNYLFLYFRNYIVNKYLDNILKNINKTYDYIFIIRGEIITKDFIEKLKIKNPNSKIIMYQWDSLQNNINYANLINYIDKVFTFDMIDAKNLGIEYLPLFYINKYEQIELKENRKYDIVFFGSYHGDRLRIVKELSKKYSKDLNLKLHLFIPKTVLFKRLLTGQIKFKDLKYLSTSTINGDEILEFYSNTKSALDIENINQNGFTIRTFEVLGSGLKLITTNKNILDDNLLYDPKNTYFLNRNNIIIDETFFKNIKLKEYTYRQYSLENWIFNVFK